MRVQSAGTSQPSGLFIEPVPFSNSPQVLTCIRLSTSVLLNVFQSLLPFYTPPPETGSRRVEMSDNWFMVIIFFIKHNIVSKEEGWELKERDGDFFSLLARGPGRQWAKSPFELCLSYGSVLCWSGCFLLCFGWHGGGRYNVNQPQSWICKNF